MTDYTFLSIFSFVGIARCPLSKKVLDSNLRDLLYT